MSTTKTVEGYFGPKEVTREAYVSEWVQHFQQVTHLAGNMADLAELGKMSDRVAEMAGKKWDSLKTKVPS